LQGGTPAQQIDEVTARLARNAVSAYVVDVTSPDVRSLGLHVTRAVSPELCALDVAHGARYLGGPRLYRAAYDAGLAAAPLDPAAVNPLPHPFP
jgi:ribosomal protein S12 methylthiotransferase accessory factor